MSELVVDLTSGLYQFMLNSEQLLLSTPRKKKEEIGRQLVEQSLQLLERYNTARQQVGERFIERFDDISQSLRSFSNELKKRSWTPETMWSHWHKLSLQYEALLAQAKQLRLRDLSKVRIAHLKPRNFSRNIFPLLSRSDLCLVIRAIALKRGPDSCWIDRKLHLLWHGFVEAFFGYLEQALCS